LTEIAQEISLSLDWLAANGANASQTEVRLFMWTGSFAPKNPVAIANQQQIDVLQPYRRGSIAAPAGPTDRS
jgi:hypothetical protein